MQVPSCLLPPFGTRGTVLVGEDEWVASICHDAIGLNCSNGILNGSLAGRRRAGENDGIGLTWTGQVREGGEKGEREGV